MPHLLLGAAAAGAGSLAAGSAVAGGALAGTSAIAAGATIAGGATALVPGVAAAAGVGSTVWNILQGLTTAAGALGAISAAQSDSTQAFSNAIQSDLEAGQSQVATEQQASSLKRELAKVLGENDVAIAASGIDLSGGIAESTRADAKRQTADQLSISRQDDDMRRALLKARANGYRAQSASYESGGLLKALGAAAGFGTDILQRG